MTDLKTKVTSALNETRMLILGAQILLGFQLSAVFQPGFEHLKSHARWLDFAALALMSTAVVCLIAPAPFHQLVERGRDSARMHGFATRMAAAALFPFGMCIGIDVFIVTELLFGTKPSIIAGAAFTGIAALLWYGLESVQRHREGASPMDPRDDEREVKTDLSEKINTMLIEARVILPGAQALLGFQFAAFLTSGFEQLSQAAKLVHFGCLACVALTVIFLMAPAAYHRLVAGGEDRPDVYRFGSNVILVSLLPLAAGLSGEFYVVAVKLGYSDAAAMAAMLIVLAAFLGLWFVYPLLARVRQAESTRPALRVKQR
ncbi:MAG TPA: DUF6328 family protein [Stellaceae bacterium]